MAAADANVIVLFDASALLRSLAAACTPPLTRRQEAALNFIVTWKLICRRYGRRTFCDYRVRAARLRYLAAVAAECWSPAT